MNIGKKILNLRKKYHLSQEQLSEKVKVTRQTISNWELGETTPSAEQLKLLSKALNVSIDELLDNDTKTIFEHKLERNEQLTTKQFKYTKTILLIIYFLILIGVISIGIYWYNKKDFTSKYDLDFKCHVKNSYLDENVQVYVVREDDNTYTIEVAEDNMITIKEKADNIIKVYEIVSTLKKAILNQGGICRPNE